MKIGVISLGCTKNLVDTETFLGVLNKQGNEFVEYVSEADLLLINTCGFIESAKQEAIDTIFNVVNEKKKDAKIVVVGCLPQRYKEDLIKLIPEVDRFISISEYNDFSKIIDEVMGKPATLGLPLSCLNRVLTTPSHLAYVKISDGCNNKCHYCAIPLIRGEFKSRPKEDIIKEVNGLVEMGVKEIVLISQDTTRYGSDIYQDYTIANLLKDLLKNEDLYMLRLLYLYPDEITDELIDTFAENSRLASYFDIPIQHASDKVLASMNRRSKNKLTENIIAKIRKKVPNAILRTTVIVGYPTEEEKDFQELLKMVKKVKFDRLGAFIFSSEEGTEAARLYPDLIDKKICEERYDRLMSLQRDISLQQNKKKVGNIYDVIVEDYDFSKKKYIGRSYMNASDDVDGYIYFSSNHVLKTGEIVKVKITEADYYDLIGKIVS
ncbi:MAG: 30S ribosomal protein S12 methylthiotransferase RimO [Erysipelotrichaceae bacterium]|nr:30S ribosomal protein S12 methylthiotransferase RimO [Erysipelotrichaceae bacterium]